MLRVRVGGVELERAAVRGDGVSLVVQSCVAVAEAVEGVPGFGVGLGDDLEDVDSGLELVSAEKTVAEGIEARFYAGVVTVLRIGGIGVQRCEGLIVTVLRGGSEDVFKTQRSGRVKRVRECGVFAGERAGEAVGRDGDLRKGGGAGVGRVLVLPPEVRHPDVKMAVGELETLWVAI